MKTKNYMKPSLVSVACKHNNVILTSGLGLLSTDGMYLDKYLNYDEYMIKNGKYPIR